MTRAFCRGHRSRPLPFSINVPGRNVALVCPRKMIVTPGLIFVSVHLKNKRNKYEIRLLFRTTTRIPLRSRNTLRFAAFTTSPHPRSITSRKHTQIHAHLANMSQDSTVCKNIPRNRPTRKFIPKIPNISLYKKKWKDICPIGRLGFALQRANSRMLRNADRRRRLARVGGKYSSGTRPLSSDDDY